MGAGVCSYRTTLFPQSTVYAFYRMMGTNGRATKIAIDTDVSQSFSNLIAI